MRYRISYTRTLIHQEEIEFPTFDEANTYAEQTSGRMGNNDYTDAESDWEVATMFFLECVDCLQAEGLNDDIPWCKTCTLASPAHIKALNTYITRVNEVLRQENTRCDGCRQFHFGCTLSLLVDELTYLCTSCSQKLAARVE